MFVSDDVPRGPGHSSGRDPKLQRWIDLLAALLVRRLPTTFEELARDVPEYARKLDAARTIADEKQRQTQLASLKRAFERDKDELRAFGVRIESAEDEDGNPSGAYRLRPSDFYLPYLFLVVPGRRAEAPARRSEWGYRALQSLAFEADELQAVVDAAACVRSLGDPLLAADAASALRKLAVDLPVDAASPGTPRVVLPRSRPEAATFDALSDALVRRKAVTFAYRAMSSDHEDVRELEPYGLFFLHGHWYVAGRDRARDALRNFRLNRITRPVVNPLRRQSPDYEIPLTFDLRAHARSRQAWELGDGEAMAAVVELRGDSGPVVAARQLGETAGDAHVFHVRRADVFVRWLLSFGGAARPVAPASVVAGFDAVVRTTAAVYARPPLPAPAIAPYAAERSAAPWQPRGAAEQLKRILSVVPRLADGEEHAIADVAAHVGANADTLRRDLFSLSERYDTPGGFVDAMRIFLGAETVAADSSHFLRPMRLTVSELCALELGLVTLRAQRTPDEHETLERARGRLHAVIARLDDDPIPDGIYGASLGECGSTGQLATVRAALARRKKLRLVYRRSGVEGASERVACPHALLSSNGMLYVIALCDASKEIRVFRMDRLECAEMLEDDFEPVAGFSADAVLMDGRVFSAPDAASMTVWYSPAIARWIAEREGRTTAADGSLVMEHPLADREWAMRHVLQYGPDAEVLEPSSLRAELRKRLEELGSGSWCVIPTPNVRSE